VRAADEGGFGTKLIQQTARSYGGSAQIDFRAEGVHCRVELPLADAQRAPSETRRRTGATDDTLLAAQRNESNILRGKRILVVEDEPLVAIDIRACLASAGCEVLGPAGTIAEAKALIEHANFDAAYLDLNLAGDSSEELAQTLTRKNIPFAFLTGYQRAALPAAFRDCVMLAKPFGREQLIAVTEALLYLAGPAEGVVRMRRNQAPRAAVA